MATATLENVNQTVTATRQVDEYTLTLSRLEATVIRELVYRLDSYAKGTYGHVARSISSALADVGIQVPWTDYFRGTLHPYELPEGEES